jgi:hypothetical protein
MNFDPQDHSQEPEPEKAHEGVGVNVYGTGGNCHRDESAPGMSA